MEMPDGQAVLLEFSRSRVSLGCVLHIREAEYLTQPGSVVPKDYRCRVEVETPDGRREALLRLNHPLRVRGLQVSQGAWLPRPQRPMQIQLLVSSRPGVPSVWIGCVLVIAGLLYAFYVKPLVLRRREGRT
jgi:hypothetical protein